MLKKTNCFLLLLFLLAVSCRQATRNEQADIAYWNANLLDSSKKLLYANEDTTEALRYYDSVLKTLDNPTAYAKAGRFEIVSQYYYFFSPNDKATLVLIDAGLAMYNTPELQNQYPRSYLGLLLFGGQIAYRLNHYNKANDYYFKAKKIADAHLDPCERKAFNYSIAMTLYRQENYTESLRYFQQAYSQQSTCSPQTTAVVLQQQEIQSNIGLCFVQLKRYDSALVYFDKALAIANNNKDSLGPKFMDMIQGVLDGNKAKVLMATNRLEEAETLSRRSIALNDREGYEKENAVEVKLQLADIYGRKKDFASMGNVLNGLQPTIANANGRMQMEWRRLMAAYYEQTGQPVLSVAYLKSYFLLKDSVAAEQKNLAAADVIRQLRDKEQELQINLLKKDNHFALVSLLVTILFSGMIIAILFLIYQNYRRSKKNLALSLALNEEISRQKAAREEEARQRHKLITEAVIKAQESERSAIGLELHDNINQVLTTVKLHNEMVMEGMGDPKVILSRASKYLQDCINEIRSLSKRLSAPTLGKISLEESVKDLIDSVNLASKVKITHQLTGFDNQLLQQDLHLGLYRILQEQLNNVLKHAHATEVHVALAHTEDRLHLAVTDNGQGFAVGRVKGGIGLMNMQTRAENLNGTFKLSSQPGKGCKIEVVIPLPCVQ